METKKIVSIVTTYDAHGKKTFDERKDARKGPLVLREAISL